MIAMRPKPPNPPEHLAGDLAWFLEAYHRLGLPFSVGPMTGVIDRRASMYVPRMELLDREWPSDLEREAPLAIWSDLDDYHMAQVQAEMEAAANG